MANELSLRCRKRRSSGFELNADLRIPLDQAWVTVLFGPSGSGKTTLLRLIAGLESPDEGEIRFRGTAWHDSAAGIHLPPQARRAGFLFQDYALFPHLTVERNVAFGANAGQAGQFLDAFGLTDLARRYPRELSGGQQQRVSLARALAASPALLLLDEPLSALDQPARLRARQDLRKLLAASAAPSIVVTHDRVEAVALGDWIAVLAGGSIRQAGPVREVFRRPADAVVAESVGVENVLPAEVEERRADGLLVLRVGSARLECVDASGLIAGGSRVLACVRAEDVTLSAEGDPLSSARNRIAGRLISVAVDGPLARVEMDCGFPLAAAITAQSASDLGLAPGNRIYAIIKATSVHPIAE